MLEALFAAAAEAVFSYILDTLEPAQRLRDWLKRNPAKLAYQHALARTYVAFARQYPELTSSLFNESFLTIEAAPELAKFLTRHQHPDHTQLVRLWAKSISPQTEAGQESIEALSKREDLDAASAYFVELLTSELKQASALQPLFDSRALESLPAIEAKLDTLTATLQSNLKQALTIANNYQQTVVNNFQQAITNRSGGVDFQAQEVTIGGDVVGRDKITTDINTNGGTYVAGNVNVDRGSEFVGGNKIIIYFDVPVASEKYYIEPDEVFDRVKVDSFVGREWLIAKVDAFLTEPNRKSGIFLLVGDAGVGKTSFMAHLVHQRGYIHVFGEQARGNENLPMALLSLGVQIVSRYDLDSYRDLKTLKAARELPNYLDRLLRLAADKLNAGEKIVIVCDALDEAGTAPNGNVFGLPSVLPDGVYFILSQRPVTLKLSVKADLVKETVDAAGADNLHDVEQYLIAVARRPEVSNQLRAHNYTETDFVRILKERSGGVWMYLFYVVSEIGAGSRAPLDLATLPPGLVGYYTDYWGDWREGRNGRGDGSAKWDAVYAPLLATLAAAQLPITLKLLLDWSQVQIPEPEVKRLLRSKWPAFVSERSINGMPHFSLYHASLRDFLTGQVERQGLTTESDQLIQELVDCTRDAHIRIVEYYRQQCNGDWVKLVDDDYARTHLYLHLSASGNDETMYRLVAMSNAWAEAKYAKEESYAGYLVDLNRAWQYTETEARWNISRQIRCALIESSVHSLASNVPDDLLRQLVEANIWSPARALAHILQIPSEDNRAMLLREVAPLLLDELKPEALAAARAIQDEGVRAEALSGLAPALPDALKDEALAAARTIQDEGVRAEALSGLAPALPDALKDEVLIEALAAARTIQDEGDRARILSDLAPALPDALKDEVLIEALAAARTIQDEGDRARILSDLAPALPDTLKDEALIEALAGVRTIQDEQDRALILSELALLLPESLGADILTEALATARTIQDERDRSRVLADLALLLPESLETEILTEALETARTIQDEFSRALALSDLTPTLPESLKAEALAAARTIHDEWPRALALSELAPALAEPLKTKVLAEALAAARAIRYKEARVQTLSTLAPTLPESLKAEVLTEALVTARTLQDARSRAERLVTLAPMLSGTLKAQVLTEALATARALQDEWRWVQVLSSLAPVLQEPLKTKVLTPALAAACTIEDEASRALRLSDLAPALPESLKAEALTAARSIQDEKYKVHVLFTLAPILPDPLRAEVLTEALAIVRTIQDEGDRARILSDLAPALPESLKAEALTVARAIQDAWNRARALSALAPTLPDLLNVEVLAEALAAARAIQGEYGRAEVLSALAPTLPEPLQTEVLAEALATARAIQDAWNRAFVLSKIAPTLPESLKVEVLTEALTAACAIRGDEDRSQGLIALAPMLPESLMAKALTAACAIQDSWNRAQALSALAPTLPEYLKTEVLAKVRTLQNEESRAELLSALASTLSESSMDEALAAAYAIKDKGPRAQALSALAPTLTNGSRIKMFNEAIHLLHGRLSAAMHRRSWLYSQIVSSWGKERFHGFQRQLWPETLHALTQQLRDELLDDLAALVPLIEHLGGQAAIEEFFYALRDVTTWWP